jgi:hypothetical protein
MLNETKESEMTTKTYFAKVSWQRNEVVREHTNIEFATDLTTNSWSVVRDAYKTVFGRGVVDPTFTIDFMIEVPQGE